MSERERDNVEEEPARDDLENAIIAADDTGMVSNEADITNAEIREAIRTPNGEDRTG
ncbi:MAG: hypothetical protein ABSB70_17405 [Candidatus Velthaea sp.]|jgi:hypothetical protein